MLSFFGAVLIAQGVVIVWALPDQPGEFVGDTRRAGRNWGWSEIIRNDGPILERIPAPYVVLTILGGAAVAMIAWSLLVRWTDIDEAL